MYSVINSADLIIPDGIGVVYASKILGTPLKQKVAGVETADLIAEYASKTGDGIFIFGGGKATSERPCVARLAADKLCEKYPGLVISGVRDGYFSDADNQSIADEINASGAKILFVCLGAETGKVDIR